VATARLTARAVADLERIFEFVAASDPKRALAVTESLRDAIDVLTRHPLVGRRVEDGMRELVAGSGKSTFVARYRWYPDSEQVLVLAIRHAREVGYLDE
jgi:plasmid stabilization system protein ParE